MQELVCAHGSYGDLLVDPGTGRVLEVRDMRHNNSDTGHPYHGIRRCDLAEYRRHYGKVELSIDILDIGYWYDIDGVAGYEPAEPDFRKQVMLCSTESL